MLWTAIVYLSRQKKKELGLDRYCFTVGAGLQKRVWGNAKRLNWWGNLCFEPHSMPGVCISISIVA